MGEVVQADFHTHWLFMLPEARLRYLNKFLNLKTNHCDSGEGAEVISLAEIRRGSPDCKCSYCAVTPDDAA